MIAEAQRIIEQLALRPHPEGGHFAETFRSHIAVNSASHEGARSASTAIYFLLKAGEFSALHRVRSDEVWHYYVGAPLELVLITEESAPRSERVRLGRDLGAGERPQFVVPAGAWQAARPLASAADEFSLCGCTVAPGFAFRDFEMPTRSELLARLPAYAELIREFTR